MGKRERIEDILRRRKNLEQGLREIKESIKKYKSEVVKEALKKAEKELIENLAKLNEEYYKLTQKSE